jgi:cytochrome oxidase assembly protein ShyY1
MYKFLIRPIWLLLHVTVVATILLMINLAFWQIGRYHEKIEFNQTVKERISAPILPVEQLLDAIKSRSESPESVEWRTVLVVGEYIDDETVEAVNRAQDGYSGKDPLTPIRLANNQLLLMNRGFISISKDVDPAPLGQVQIIGRVRAPEIRRRFRISDPAQGELLEMSNIDLERLNMQMPSELAPIYVEVLESKPSDSPELSRIAAPALSTGSHLSYTFQWFTFSVFVLAGWIIVIHRKIKTVKATKTL